MTAWRPLKTAPLPAPGPVGPQGGEQHRGRHHSAGRHLAQGFEIIVIDDGSRDATPAMAAAIVGSRGALPGQPRLPSGLAATRMPWILIIDAGPRSDRQRPQSLLELSEPADPVSAGRAHSRGSRGRWTAPPICNRLARPPRPPRQRGVIDRARLRGGRPAASAELPARAEQAGRRVARADVRARRRAANDRPGRHLTGLGRAERELCALRGARPGTA